MMIELMIAASSVLAQQAQPDVGILASAYDRCMATIAVRQTHTDATDEAIYAQAVQSCGPLKTQLTAAINAQLPQAQASQLIQAMDAQGRPNFMAMVAQIRADRARRAGQ